MISGVNNTGSVVGLGVQVRYKWREQQVLQAFVHALFPSGTTPLFLLNCLLPILILYFLFSKATSLTLLVMDTLPLWANFTVVNMLMPGNPLRVKVPSLPLLFIAMSRRFILLFILFYYLFYFGERIYFLIDLMMLWDWSSRPEQHQGGFPQLFPFSRICPGLVCFLFETEDSPERLRQRTCRDEAGYLASSWS